MRNHTEGRRTTDHERTHLRHLEQIVRNFITHFEDQPDERSLPRVLRLVTHSKTVCRELDKHRAPRANSKPADNS